MRAVQIPEGFIYYPINCKLSGIGFLTQKTYRSSMTTYPVVTEVHIWIAIDDVVKE